MAVGVACYHFTIWYPVFQPGRFMATTAAKVGHYGVEGFFLLSGFCLFHACLGAGTGPGAAWRFYRKRFVRIAPLYYLAVALNLALGLAAGPQPSLRMLAENATLTFALFHPNHAMVVGGWAIGIECVFYLAFPLLAWAAVRFKPFLALAAGVLFLLSLPYTLEAVPAASMAGDMKFHTYVQIANHAFLFFLGGLVAQVRARLPWRLRSGAFLVPGAGLALVFSRYLRHFYDHFTVLEGPPRYTFVLLCLGMVVLFAFRDLGDSPWKRAGAWLGRISYAVYLAHPFANAAVQGLAPVGLPPALGFGLALGLTLGLAALAERWIERPAMKLA